jgi:hypothetical protein
LHIVLVGQGNLLCVERLEESWYAVASTYKISFSPSSYLLADAFVSVYARIDKGIAPAYGAPMSPSAKLAMQSMLLK